MSWFRPRKKNVEIKDVDWRDMDALPQEVISKRELDTLQKEVVSELLNMQAEAINDSGSAKPQALFFFHKYIDSKFNKQDFDVDTYFAKKQDAIDQKYTEGLGEINAEFTKYEQLLGEVKELDQRLKRKTLKLDPNSNVKIEEAGAYDDIDELRAQINALPKEINWRSLKEKQNEA